MGNQDNWTTPKSIKIERAGDPRPLRRGPLKKGDRRKGLKARLDELLSSKKTLERYAEYVVRDWETRVKHPEWYQHPDSFNFHWAKHFDEHQKKHAKLLTAAFKDKIIESAFDWLVFKP